MKQAIPITSAQRSNRPLYDTGWRVGMPAFVNLNREVVRHKDVTITAMDGTNHTVTLVGYGMPEYLGIDR
jgi:hypothetical protein